MAPKSTSGKEKLIEEDEVLQAVILADSFNKRFKPLTTRKPRCLLPICNAPLLDWTFESLALAGVQEIFVVCRSYADLVKEAIKESKWSKPSSGLKIVPIVTAKETFSPGDAMRDVYTHGVITSDFVLVTGDLVSNVRIDEVVKAHKERRKTNKDAIMTMVVKESGANHRTRSRGDTSVFVLDAETSECLHYEPVTGFPPTTHTRIPREILEAHPELEIRNDLIDCSIDVCSVEVPSLFQDNFDYQDIRKDFVHGILTSDLLMKNIHCYVAKDGYAARVKDTRSYDSISKDILSRWTFPLVPDDNHPGGHIYEYIRGNKYIAKDNTVILSRTCKIGNNTLIGSSTKILENAQITSSVIGQRCIIGAGTVVRNAYIFDDSVIGPGCFIEQSIIGAGVNVKERSRIEKGCLVGDGVIVGPQAVLVPFERLSKRREQNKDGKYGTDGEDEDSDVEEVEANQDESTLASLGEDSNAIVWPRPILDEDEEVDPVEAPDNQRLMRIGDDVSDLDLSDAGSITSDEDDYDSSDDSDNELNLSALASSTTSLPLSSSASMVASADARLESEFKREVQLSLERAFAEGHSVDNAAVELKTLRMASNVPLIRVREAVVGGIVDRIKIAEGGAAPQRAEIASVVGRWGDLINQIGGVDAVETVSVLQMHCAASERMPLFGQILAALYQDDVVEEDDIRKWHALPESKGIDLKPGANIENIKKCWSVGARMIAQFDEQESDEDESEDNGSAKKPQPATKQIPGKKSEVEESEDEDSDEDSESDEDVQAESITKTKPEVDTPVESEEEESEVEQATGAGAAEAEKIAEPEKEPETEKIDAVSKDESESGEDESEEDESEPEPENKVDIEPDPEKKIAAEKKEESEGGDDESEEEESEPELDQKVEVEKKPEAGKKDVAEGKDESEAGEDESEEDESEPEPDDKVEVEKKVEDSELQAEKKDVAEVKDESESEEDESEEDESEPEPEKKVEAQENAESAKKEAAEDKEESGSGEDDSDEEQSAAESEPVKGPRTAPGGVKPAAAEKNVAVAAKEDSEEEESEEDETDEDELPTPTSTKKEAADVEKKVEPPKSVVQPVGDNNPDPQKKILTQWRDKNEEKSSSEEEETGSEDDESE